jgi:hypothetical protein
MFKKGDIVKVVDFSNDHPNTMFKLADDHPYRRLGEGECEITTPQIGRSPHVTLKNLENGTCNTIYAWRCVLVKSTIIWEV